MDYQSLKQARDEYIEKVKAYALSQKDAWNKIGDYPDATITIFGNLYKQKFWLNSSRIYIHHLVYVDLTTGTLHPCPYFNGDFDASIMSLALEDLNTDNILEVIKK